MASSEGTINFERLSDGRLTVRQGWNPSKLSRSDRVLIAQELRSIAEHISCDEFEDKQTYKKYPIDAE